MVREVERCSWRGVDLNHRPSDYAFDPVASTTCRVGQEGRFTSTWLYATSRMASGRFPVRRGGNAGHTGAFPHVYRIGFTNGVRRTPLSAGHAVVCMSPVLD